LNVTTAHAVIAPGSTPGSGTVAPVNVNGQPLLGLSYLNFESVTAVGGKAVIDGTEADDNITVSATGIVTVTNTLGFQNSVNVSGYNSLLINALGGNDSIRIFGSAPWGGGLT